MASSIILLAGLVVTILGWFFDRLAHFPALAKIVARDAHYALDGLALLAEDNRRALLPAHPGFTIIVSSWPGLDTSAAPEVIARSVAFIQFGGQISNDFELIARKRTDVELSPRWRHALAVKEIQSRAEKRAFWYGTVVFWVGIGLSLTAGVMDFLSRS